ncbi:SLATT domain-containing protein [Nocardia vaccinii]|uniref:SLATT domain-containing protein n=1 Tax=Nocardia vaccinii TaxID=1822 RepID=UPI00082FC5C4|nr:SLATT domain-containing protein [Nocardia vaccinii]
MFKPRRPDREPSRARSSGLHSPESPPAGADTLAISLHYLTFYRNEYQRSRVVVKTRAKRVVVWTAVANGLIAVVGAAVAVFQAPWLGLASTALAASIGVLTAWDGLYRHREMWVQRSVILGQLQALLRTTELRRAEGGDHDALARETMRHLNAILEEDLEAWTSLRRTQSAPHERDTAPAE